MKIAVVGTGYVGLVTGVCFAELGHQVSCVDIDKEKIDKLLRGESPIYEPGIDRLLKKNIHSGRLEFFSVIKDGIDKAQVIFIAVGTPSRADGTVETKCVEAVAKEIGRNLKRYVVIVNKSTVPVGTGEKVRKIVAREYGGRFDIVSNPEFLREGQAIRDFMSPDRVVIGIPPGRAEKIMRNLYAGVKTEVFFTTIKTAEMIKYASNSFLAASISFINSLSELCEKVGANINDVAHGMKLDKRIGRQAFLTAGPGFGGSCFPKDVLGLVNTAKQFGVNLPLLAATINVNIRQSEIVFGKVKSILGVLRGKTVAVWGLAFKPETDDLRESPAVNLVRKLVDAGAEVKCFDKVAEENGRKMFPKVFFAKNPLDAIFQADCLVIMTEWRQFREIKLAGIKKYLKQDNIVDARNIYKKTEAIKLGFKYEGIGQ